MFVLIVVCAIEAEQFGMQEKLYVGPFASERQARNYIESGMFDSSFCRTPLEWNVQALDNPLGWS